MPIKSIFGLLVLVSLLVSCNQKEKVEANINSYTNVVLVQSEMVVESSIKKIIHLMLRFNLREICPCTITASSVPLGFGLPSGKVGIVI